MSYTRKSLADHLDSYDDEIAELQDSKRQMLADYRAELADKGFSKSQIKAEVDAFKIALRRRRAIAKKGEDEVEQADAIADEIFIEITGPAPRATRVHGNIEEFDAETGEIKDEPETAAEVAGDYLREPVAAEQGQIVREGDAPRETDRNDDGDDCLTGGDASCPDTATQSVPADTRFSSSLAAREADESAAPHSHSADPSPSQDAAEQTGAAPSLPAAPVTISDADVPAFLKRAPATSLRPNCLRPENCAGYGSHTCHSCQRAAETVAA